MTSDKGVAGDGFDERLAAIRDGILSKGETVLFEEEGDQGQAIVLTNTRVIVMKVGITATGSSGGKIVGVFPLSEVTGVNVRKGPLGAVIQVCADGSRAVTPGEPPDNVIVFTGSQRMKKCESIAGRIEEALGKPVCRIEARPEQAPMQQDKPAESAEEPAAEIIESEPVQPDQDASELIAAAEAAVTPVKTEPERKAGRGGREARSLADEMFAEIVGEEKMPAHSESSETPPEPASAVHAETQPEAAAPLAEVPTGRSVEPSSSEKAAQGYGPNPHLPKPASRPRRVGGALVVLGGLLAALLVGVAVTAPLRVSQKHQTAQISTAELTSNLGSLRRQSSAVEAYKERVVRIVAASNQSAAGVESALRSGNGEALARALSSDATSSAWRSLRSLNVPAGLVGAKDNLSSGLFIRKNAMATLSSELRSGGPVGVKEALSRLAESRSLISKGLQSISAMQADLGRQMSRDRASTRRRKGSGIR